MTAASQKLSKPMDPRDDVSGQEFQEDLLFFNLHGGKNLVRALLWQTISDVLESKTNPQAPDDIHHSARWPKTPAGRATIEFLMPGVSSDVIIAKIYEDPALFISTMSRVNKGDNAERVLAPEAGVFLEHEAASTAFGERPLVSEDDQPLEDSSHYDSSSESAANTPSSWG